MTFLIPLEAKLKYLERRKKDLEQSTVAIANQDYEWFEKMGHDLKGNAVTFGFDSLSTIGEELEVAAQEMSLEKIKKSLEAIRHYLNSLS